MGMICGLLAFGVLFLCAMVFYPCKPTQADAQPSSRAQDVKAADREKAWNAEMERLKKEAADITPKVQAAQAERLAKFNADYATDLAKWEFHVSRWGDFIDVRISRGGKKTVQAIALTDSPIVLTSGREPDMNGSVLMMVQQIVTSGGEEKGYLDPDGDDPGPLPPQDTVGGAMYGATGNVGSIDGIARRAKDATITFGQGGGIGSCAQVPTFNGYAIGSGSWQSSASTCSAKPGATLNVPAGQGEAVYAAILAAVKAGTPESRE